MKSGTRAFVGLLLYSAIMYHACVTQDLVSEVRSLRWQRCECSR